MVKPLRPQKSQDRRVPGFVWMIIGLLRGDNGVALKLTGSLKCYQVEMAGVVLYWRSRFIVSSV